MRQQTLGKPKDKMEIFGLAVELAGLEEGLIPQ